MEFLSFAPHYYDGGRPQISLKSLWQAADQPKAPVWTFLPASPVGEPTGGEKWRAYWSPVAAASKIVKTRWQTKHHSNQAWAYRMSIKKLGSASGIKLICGPGPQVKIFLPR
jgi:hypothetical protein